ncbi:MAG: hypothetical protein DHS20C16_08020 [Phycisphaerae bacterium]|nr:MAG: hypothetical protein DHS20C16_08020 [Phycisphaerae bacterium]
MFARHGVRAESKVRRWRLTDSQWTIASKVNVFADAFRSSLNDEAVCEGRVVIGDGRDGANVRLAVGARKKRPELRTGDFETLIALASQRGHGCSAQWVRYLPLTLIHWRPIMQLQSWG